MIKKYTAVEGTKQITIEELIGSEGRYVGPTVGVSMLPMLKTGRDSVVIVKKEARLRPLDVALYKRGDKYVLHRVISVIDGGYIIRGDNCYSDEKIPESAVFGVLKAGEKLSSAPLFRIAVSALPHFRLAAIS